MQQQEAMFTIEVPTEYYRSRKIPNYPGVTEHLIYLKASEVPENLPHGCNPRDQDIDKAIYKKVLTSFEDLNDPSYCLKNKGTTILAPRVFATPNGKTTTLKMDIPADLGNVDGHHSYLILLKGRKANPNQYVKLCIIEGLPAEVIPLVAEGLNTGLQVTARSMANLQHLLDPIHKVLGSEEYYDFIKFKDNEDGKSVDVKDIVALMWVLCPSLYEKGQKHPNWIYQKPSAVFDQTFFNSRDNSKEYSVRSEMLKLADVLPVIIRLYLHVAEVSVRCKPLRRSKVKTGDQEEKGLERLFEKRQIVPFRDPTNTEKVTRLREPYLRMLVAGARCLLKYNEGTGSYEFIVSEDVLFSIADGHMRKTLDKFLKSLEYNRYDQNKTTRDPSLWDIAFTATETEWLKKHHSIESAAE